MLLKVIRISLVYDLIIVAVENAKFRLENLVDLVCIKVSGYMDGASLHIQSRSLTEVMTPIMNWYFVHSNQT